MRRIWGEISSVDDSRNTDCILDPENCGFAAHSCCVQDASNVCEQFLIEFSGWIIFVTQAGNFGNDLNQIGVLASESWREVWRPSPQKVDPGAFSGQRQRWKTPKRTPWQCTASVCVAGVHCWEISLGLAYPGNVIFCLSCLFILGFFVYVHCVLSHSLSLFYSAIIWCMFVALVYLSIFAPPSPSVWPHLFCGAGHEKRRGEQLKWSLAFRLYIGSFVFHVHRYQDQFIQSGWAECVLYLA